MMVRHSNFCRLVDVKKAKVPYLTDRDFVSIAMQQRGRAAGMFPNDWSNGVQLVGVE
jgi:hypothetical protein